MADRRVLGSEWVYDELLCFVGSPLFQIPVASFMENNCLIFDPSLEDCGEYRDAHRSYRELVTALLDAFRQDTNLSHDQIIQAMAEMSKKDDLQEIFQELFKQILATESFNVFVRVMTEKNIELQQQALLLLLHRLGHTPDSLKITDRTPQTLSGGQQPSQYMATMTGNNPSEEQDESVFQSIIRSADTSVVKSAPLSDIHGNVVDLSREEVNKLEAEKKREQQRLTEAVRRMSLSGEDEGDSIGQMENKAISGLSATKPKQTAASPVSWGGSSGGGEAEVTAEEIAKRQEFLRQQKEKLMALKQKEREKQLDTYEQGQSSRLRPKSSRAARSAVLSTKIRDLPAQAPPEDAATAQPPVLDNEEEQKKLAMRRAIASRLRAEMLGK